MFWRCRLPDAHLTTPTRSCARSSTFPFGVPGDPPREALAAPGLALGSAIDSDIVLVCNCGLWSWLYAPNGIRAVALLAGRRPR